jgi:hypothetical protein
MAQRDRLPQIGDTSMIRGGLIFTAVVSALLGTVLFVLLLASPHVELAESTIRSLSLERMAEDGEHRLYYLGMVPVGGCHMPGPIQRSGPDRQIRRESKWGIDPQTCYRFARRSQRS